MTRLFSTILFISLTVGINAQSKEFNDEVRRSFNDVTSSGYTILDEGPGEMHYDYGHLFRYNNFDVGEYYIGVIIDNCRSCNVEIIFEDLDSGRVRYISPDMIRGNNNVSAAGYFFKQTIKGRGRVQVVLKEKYERYAHSMLLKKN
jgi:hypothetical protein